ncbi:MAG: hypothetical protein RMI91_02410 [Gemmatales bacterium]|nr:hypothetical protein [Gemmatales bacterium]MDW7993481.1 hypothetical protein [Gemmatales bacterium]
MYSPERELWSGSWRLWLINGLGGCPRCMRWSLLLCVAAWSIFLGVLAWNAQAVVRWTAFVGALTASVWWLAHWGAYVGKRCLLDEFLAQEQAHAHTGTVEDNQPVVPRRLWLQTVLRYATVGLAGTLFGLDRVFGQPVPCTLPTVLLVAAPTEECSRNLSEAFRNAMQALQTHGSSFADSLCAQRSRSCGRGRCRRIAARNPEDIRPDIRQVVGPQGQRLWCVRCFGAVRIICGCV